MSMMQVPLPDALREFVEEQAARRGFGSAGDYVCALIRAEQKRAAQAKLEELLLEGLNSGTPIEATDEYWEEKLRRYDEHHHGEISP